MDLSKLKEKKNVSVSAPKREMLPLDPADEELLRDDNDEPVAVTLAFMKDGIKRKEQPDDQSVSWFVKTQYISPINTKATKQRIGKRRVKMRERLGARNILENLYDRESKRKETEASFEACRSLPAHATNKELQPVEVLPLLPDFDRFRNELPDITRECNILLLKRDPERLIHQRKMSYYNITQDMLSSSASLANDNQNFANVYNYDSQAGYQIQGNSMLSSDTIPYGYNPFNYLNNDQGAKSTFQGQTMSYPWSTENSHSRFLNDNGKSTSHMIVEAGNRSTVLDKFNPFSTSHPSNILGDPEYSHSGFPNNNGKSSSAMVVEGNPSTVLDNNIFQGNPSIILGNPENGHSVFLSNNAKSTSPMTLRENSSTVIKKKFYPFLGNPITIMRNTSFSFPIVSPANILRNPYFPITSPTFASGNFINNTRETNTLHPIRNDGAAERRVLKHETYLGILLDVLDTSVYKNNDMYSVVRSVAEVYLSLPLAAWEKQKKLNCLSNVGSTKHFRISL